MPLRFIIIFAILLGACSSKTPRDSPPPLRVFGTAAEQARPQAATSAPNFEVIAAPTRYPFTLPTRTLTTRPDPLAVARSGDGQIVTLLRPGDVLLRSDDEGQTWSVQQPNLTLNALAVGTKYWWGLGELDGQGRAQRVVSSYNAGKKWKTEATKKVLHPEPFGIVRAGRQMVLATRDYLVWTRDMGGKWRYVNPLLEQRLSALYHAPSADHWWVGSELGGVSEGTSRGKKWKTSQLPIKTPIRGFAEAPSGVVFTATRGGLWRKSEDGWREVEALQGRDLRGVTFFPNDVGVAYGAFGRLAVSRDGGETWVDHTQRVRALLSLPNLDAQTLTWRGALASKDGVLLFGDEATIVRMTL